MMGFILKRKGLRASISVVRLLLLVLIALYSSVLLTPASAQENSATPDFYKDPGLNPNRDYVNQSATEHIDPFTGALQVQSIKPASGSRLPVAFSTEKSTTVWLKVRMVAVL